jgi:hypothetical protein
MRTPFLRREAGSLINRTVIVHQRRSKHPRTGCTTLLLLPTTTKLLIIDLVSQHDPQANTQLACHRHTRLPETLLHQLAAVETFQLRIAACRVSAGLIPQKAQQRITLFADSSEPPPSPAATHQGRVFPRRRSSLSMSAAYVVRPASPPPARECSTASNEQTVSYRINSASRGVLR